MTGPATIEKTLPSHRETGGVVWDRLWQNVPTDTKDDALLARERVSERWRMMVDRLEATFGSLKGLRTIELGSGRGDLSVLLAERGARVTLFDASDKALQLARERFSRLSLRAEYLQGDMLGRLDSLSGGYDVSLSSGVIEHFKEDVRTQVIGVHREVLRPGGLSIIGVPNARCVPYRVWKFYLELRGWWPYGMEIPYTKREILRRAATAGFDRTEAKCMGLWQSISSHWGRSLFHRDVRWDHRTSVLDGSMGLLLLMFAWRGDAAAAAIGEPMGGPPL